MIKLIKINLLLLFWILSLLLFTYKHKNLQKDIIVLHTDDLQSDGHIVYKYTSTSNIPFFSEIILYIDDGKFDYNDVTSTR